MKFFKYKENDVIRFLNYNLDETLKNSLRKEVKITDIDHAEPAVLTSKEIKHLLKKLKEYKAAYKKDLLRLNVLTNTNAFNILKSYYDIDLDALEEKRREIIAKEFPQCKKVKARICVSNSYCEALVTVYAKENVRFNEEKYYSQAKLESLAKAGKIVVVDYTASRIRQKYRLERPINCVVKMHEGYEAKVITENQFTDMYVTNPDLAIAFRNDINLKDCLKDYENKFLVTYKKCLNYLVECAKVSALHEEEMRRNFQKQIQKSNDRTRDIEEAKKIIIDTTKGR